MKILNTKFGRQAIAAALILSAMASMSSVRLPLSLPPKRPQTRLL